MEPEISGECNRDRPAWYNPPEWGWSADGKPMKDAAFALLVLFLLPGAAMASQQGVIAMKNWKSMDQCAKDAQTAFPDYTADSNEKRAAKEKECLAGRNLPPREAPAPGR